MSVSEWMKTYGTMTAGFTLAASIAYTTYAVTSRFDQVQDLAQTARDTIAEVHTTVGEVKEVQASLREDLATLKANLPSAGTTVGEAGANAVTKMDEMLACPDQQPDCREDQGVRGIVRRGIDALRTPQP